MASVTSLGIHRPTALAFLIKEGLVPSNTSETRLRWHQVSTNGIGEEDGEEEELAITDHCVVWSRCSVVQRVFRFDVEQECVNQAIFANFSSEAPTRSSPSAKEYVFDQPQQRGPAPEAGIKVRKVRTSVSKLKGNEGEFPFASDQMEGETYHLSGAQDRNTVHTVKTLRRRALVVILKTKAHIIFLSGASHVVHLPFEVDKVLPLDYGILLQRNTSDNHDEPSLSRLPSHPLASSQMGFAGPSSDFQERYKLSSLTTTKQQNLPLLPLPSDLLRQSKVGFATGLPRLFSLTDPLAEIGIVMALSKLSANKNIDLSSSNDPVSSVLDPDEDLLYTSSSDEFEQKVINKPNLIAVTRNQKLGLVTVWSVLSIEANSAPDSQRGSPSLRKRTTSRRRSSYGPGVGTGTATPVSKAAPTGGEGTGVEGARGQFLKESNIRSGVADTQEDLVSQLGPAFENPSVPVKASRRVSSLLARADLSTARDKTAFSDIASSFVGFHGNRRGVSFGNYGGRRSSGPEGGIAQLHSKSFSGHISGPDSSSSSHPINDNTPDIPNAMNDAFSFEKIDLGHQGQGLRKEIILTKVYCFSLENTDRQTSIEPDGLKVFTLRPPNHNLGVEHEENASVLCLLDRQSHTLLVMELSLQRKQPSEFFSDGRPIASDGYRRGKNGYQIRVANITRHANIMDACRIRDGPYSRVLFIVKSACGRNELCLQAPWSAVFKLELPSTLVLNDPYDLNGSKCNFQNSEGGFKRILSDRPQSFIALQHAAGSNGKVYILDSGGRRHRVEIQLRPRSPYLRKIIRICDMVLPQGDGDKEPILRGWWDVVFWLRTRHEEILDIEWTALIITLFSIAIANTGDKHAEKNVRQKKRKGGLLRSSSGAETDLHSWETMLNEESKSLILPPWVQDPAWIWTTHLESVRKNSLPSSSKYSTSKPFTGSRPDLFQAQKKSPRLLDYVSLARAFCRTTLGPGVKGEFGYLPTALSSAIEVRRTALATILVGLHLLREEYKLDILAARAVHELAPILAQLGGWLGWDSWGFKNTSYYMLESADMESWLFDDCLIHGLTIPAEPFPPPSILRFIESAHLSASMEPFMSLSHFASMQKTRRQVRNATETSLLLMEMTPRTVALTNLFCSYSQSSFATRVANMVVWGLDAATLETLPESVAVAFRASISSCQIHPVVTWDSQILGLVGRDDLGELERDFRTADLLIEPAEPLLTDEAAQDVHNICSAAFETEDVGVYDESAEEDRQAITRLIFKDDQRFAEAAKLVHPTLAPIARCVPEPDWSDTEHLEAQQELVKVIAMRTLSTSIGRGLMFYCARLPLLTEKLSIHGFTLSCVMKPSNTTVTADRNVCSEEKVSWAFFHAGVEVGLSISRRAKGIDTSWILFNKPSEPKNRHAGFLLALGLNGHLKVIAKWVAFKYLTPKHTMTSIGLLLGLSVSYLGTMDTLITRLLTIHVTRLLPPGAAELNVSPLTQTSGIMGVGLLYSNTQHRRMSEIMLSEIENIDDGDNSCPLDSLGDEGYRLAAGFALGYINLGHGKDLKGLHDMHIVQRLLHLAVGTRNVNIVHILDKATAGATIAIALIFMKTHEAAIARKIDIPDTVQQFDYVRPDIFLLRTVARHLIMWNDIRATNSWMERQLPTVYQGKLKLTSIRMLNSDDMPFFNILAGLCLSIGLRFAGSGSLEVRNLMCHYLDQLIRICVLPALNYDGKLTRITVRNCQNVVALAAACIMAGTGDLLIFRRLRLLHGRTDADTPYGSHLAAHMAIGILFLGGGTHTFSTSNLATASLLCAFYPLFPNNVLDNKSHLQAFRHFWVLASEPRCLVMRDVDSHRPVSLGIIVTLRTGAEVAMTAPCLLPELDTISGIQTNDQEYWRVTLNFLDNPAHLRAFQRHQSIYVRRRAAYDAHASVFGSTMQALNDSQLVHQTNNESFQWIFTLPAFANYDRAEQALVLPAQTTSITSSTLRGTIIDDRLVLENVSMASGRSEKLWNLRILCAWADGLARRGEKWGWFGKDIVESLRTALRMRLKADERP
ncbi:Anaphase-promoting complex subunit 1 [Peltigera leucophlebia]|nr:Anaphase-promoting complex subunit 1 [Peltigera leucophlebia]